MKFGITGIYLFIKYWTKRSIFFFIKNLYIIKKNLKYFPPVINAVSDFQQIFPKFIVNLAFSNEIKKLPVNIKFSSSLDR